MAELTITTFISVDGVMQGPGGPAEDPSGGFTSGGWLVPYFDDDVAATMSEIFGNVSAFLLGRGTYDIFAGWWPNVTDPDDPVATALNTLPKFVASRTRTEFEWAGTSHIRDVVAEVPELKERFDGELQVHGSPGLAQTLIEHDLIDEYRLLVFPVILGKGKRLFAEGAHPASLELAHSKTTGSGVVISTYRRGGEFRTGLVGG